MAIVLVIIGVLSGMMLPLMTLQRQHDNITRTRTHQDYVMHALGGYLLQHKQLPCPADPVAVSSEFGIGKESLTQGIIPFRTLGIPEKWARDGFGHYMTYVPERSLLDDKHEDLCKPKEGILKLIDKRGNPALAPDPLHPQPIAVILISHGPEGRGAYLANGSASRSRVSELTGAKLENANNDFVFSEHVKSTEENYDDIILWAAFYPFMAYYAKKTYDIEQKSAGSPKSGKEDLTMEKL